MVSKMPIVQINMLPKEAEDSFEELAKKIENAILECKIDGILPGEVMVDLHTVPNEKLNKNHFVYVNIWMYGREDRNDETFCQVRQAVGTVFFEYLKVHWPSIKMLEVLPVNVLKPSECTVIE